jgi:hypothetical protein
MKTSKMIFAAMTLTTLLLSTGCFVIEPRPVPAPRPEHHWWFH